MHPNTNKPSGPESAFQTAFHRINTLFLTPGVNAWFSFYHVYLFIKLFVQVRNKKIDYCTFKCMDFIVLFYYQLFVINKMVVVVVVVTMKAALPCAAAAAAAAALRGVSAVCV